MSVLARQNPHQPTPPRRKKSRGSSFIELLVVLAIIAALASISIPAYNHYINTAQLTLAQSALDTIRKTLEAYHIDHQQYPVEIDFTTGADAEGNIVFQGMLLNQIKGDLAEIVSYTYNSASHSYTLKALANNSERTELTLTPTKLTF